MPAKIPITDKTKDFLNENYKTLGYKECAKILEMTPNRVRKIASILNLTRPLNKPFNRLTDDQKNFIFNNYYKLGAVECGKIIGITQGHVQKIAISKNIKTERKYDFSDTIKNLMNPNSKESAYTLGFIWADGTVSDTMVSINIVETDMLNIEHIFDKLGIWSKYIFKSKTHPSWQQQKFLKCYSTELARFLAKYDYRNKSQAAQTKILSIIPEDLHFYFWRGYFDGDGCAYFKEISGKPSLRTISISSSYNQDWKEISNLMNKLDIKAFSISKRIQNSKSKLSNFSIGSLPEIKKFIKYLYPNCEFDEIGLKRKFDKLNSIFNINMRKTSKYPNIFFVSTTKRWISIIRVNKKRIHIGSFSSENDAAEARNKFIRDNDLKIPIEKIY